MTSACLKLTGIYLNVVYVCLSVYNDIIGVQQMSWDFQRRLWWHLSQTLRAVNGIEEK